MFWWPCLWLFLWRRHPEKRNFNAKKAFDGRIDMICCASFRSQKSVDIGVGELFCARSHRQDLRWEHKKRRLVGRNCQLSLSFRNVSGVKLVNCFQTGKIGPTEVHSGVHKKQRSAKVHAYLGMYSRCVKEQFVRIVHSPPLATQNGFVIADTFEDKEWTASGSGRLSRKDIGMCICPDIRKNKTTHQMIEVFTFLEHERDPTNK